MLRDLDLPWPHGSCIRFLVLLVYVLLAGRSSRENPCYQTPGGVLYSSFLGCSRQLFESLFSTTWERHHSCWFIGALFPRHQRSFWELRSGPPSSEAGVCYPQYFVTGCPADHNVSSKASTGDTRFCQQALTTGYSPTYPTDNRSRLESWVTAGGCGKWWNVFIMVQG